MGFLPVEALGTVGLRFVSPVPLFWSRSAAALAFVAALGRVARCGLEVVLHDPQATRRLEVNANCYAVVLADAANFPLGACVDKFYNIPDRDRHLYDILLYFAAGLLDGVGFSSRVALVSWTVLISGFRAVTFGAFRCFPQATWRTTNFL